MENRLLQGWCICLLICGLFPASFGQKVTPRTLITGPVDESQLATLKGNTHPLAQPRFDIGAAPPNLLLNRMLLVLKRSPEQEFALNKLLDDQQDQSSSNYHHWLTPDEFGAQFGPADQDLQLVTGWLQTHGFQVSRVTNGRTTIEFSGTEAQLEQAFNTQIHKYAVNGEEHWANATDPQIPSALSPAVAGIASLHSFFKKPQYHFVGAFSDSPIARQSNRSTPLFTFFDGQDCGGNCYAVGPYDFATIYNVLPLWNSGIDGTGQTIALVARSNINIQDVTDFRNIFGLPAKAPNIIVDGFDPGLAFDELEADIDVQWAGAVARNATIDLVVSGSTETTDGVDLSALYIVDHNLAPIMSESFGQCEQALGTAGNQFYNALWKQAAAQGMSVFVSTGDNGSAGCDFNQGFAPQPAQLGLGVSGIASTPFNVAVGGTDFNDFQNPQTYWNSSNDPATQVSAKGYVPETTWNDSCTNSIFSTIGFSTNAESNCNNSQLTGFVSTIGGSGGASRSYAKPSWQTAPGVPSDGKRDLPDVSLFASNGFVGNFYIFCESDLAFFGTCNLNVPFGTFFGVGGTSVSSPAFGGIMALVNQQMQGRQGNPNFVLYKLAASQSAAGCNSSTGPGANCIFNDVTSGTIAMPCKKGSPNCTTQTAGHSYGVLSGYTAGAGYDLATGLGSVNAANLVNKWNTVSFRPTVTSLTLNPTSSLTHGQTVNVSISVAPSSGTGTPSGNASLLTSTGMSVDGFTLSNGAVSGTTNLLPGGTYTVTAHYGGDGTFGGSDSPPVTVTVNKETSSTQINLVTFDWQGHQLSSNATTAAYGSPYILRVNVFGSSGTACNPNPFGESGCPSGNVGLTDNGSALDGGTFKLNSLGYTEDQPVQFPGGNNSVQASYAGDSSFSASSLTRAYNITPAATSISTVPNCCYSVGTQMQAQVSVQAQSNGAMPGGTITFFVNGTAVPGTANYSGNAGSGSNPLAVLGANFFSSSSPFPTPGTYSLTASYSGDGNYAAASSTATSVSVKFPTPQLTLSPSSTSLQAGATLTLTTVVIGTSKTIAPTGTVSFSSNSLGPISGNVSYSTFTDQSGNIDLQAVISFVPAGTDNYLTSYSGDQNYPASGPVSVFGVVVNGNDFSISASPSSLTVSPGRIGTENILVGLQSNSSVVNISSSPCSGLPKETTCGLIGPSQVGNTTSLQLSITTTAPHFAAQNSHSDLRRGPVFALVMPLAGILLIGVSGRRGARGVLLAVTTGLLLFVLSCGGGGGGGGGGTPSDPGTPTGSYTITVTANSGAITHTTTFTLIVQ